MKWITKDTFELRVKGDVSSVILSFDQASVEEYLDFMDVAKSEKMGEWLYNFVRENGQRVGWRKNLRKKDVEQFTPTQIFDNFIKDYYLRGAISDKRGGEETRGEVLCGMIRELLGENPFKYMREHSMEQLNFDLDGSIYIRNMQTEEGQKANKNKDLDGLEFTEEDQEMFDEFERVAKDLEEGRAKLIPKK